MKMKNEEVGENFLVTPKIIKQIVLRQNDTGSKKYPCILYEREVTSDYKMKEISDGKKSPYLFEYPDQKSYPSDKVDEIILDAVKKIYPQSILKNYYLCLSVDNDKIEELKSEPAHETCFLFNPDTSKSNISAIIEKCSGGKNLEGVSKKIKIYTNLLKMSIADSLVGEYDINDEKILDEIKKVRFL